MAKKNTRPNELQEQQIQRLIPLLRRVPIDQLAALSDAIEKYGLIDYQTLMIQAGVKIRIARGCVVNGEWMYKDYAVGAQSAVVGEVGDNEWINAWIA